MDAFDLALFTPNVNYFEHLWVHLQYNGNFGMNQVNIAEVGSALNAR